MKTERFKLHEGRLKIGHFLLFVSFLLPVSFGSPPHSVCSCSVSVINLRQISLLRRTRRAVKYAPYFLTCSVREVTRHSRVVTDLLWCYISHGASHAGHLKKATKDGCIPTTVYSAWRHPHTSKIPFHSYIPHSLPPYFKDLLYTRKTSLLLR